MGVMRVLLLLLLVVIVVGSVYISWCLYINRIALLYISVKYKVCVLQLLRHLALCLCVLL